MVNYLRWLSNLKSLNFTSMNTKVTSSNIDFFVNKNQLFINKIFKNCESAKFYATVSSNFTKFQIFRCQIGSLFWFFGKTTLNNEKFFHIPMSNTQTYKDLSNSKNENIFWDPLGPLPSVPLLTSRLTHTACNN